MLGYKVAESNGKRVIVTLEIPEDAITNMNRSTVKVKETAKYRCNKAFVVKIEDEEGNLYKIAKTSHYQDKILTYKVKENIEELSFDMDLENICAEGIHFFLTKRVAELYNIWRIKNGLFEEWHNNGVQDYRVLLKDGKEEGLYESWYYSGTQRERINYRNGKAEGMYECWYESGRKYFQIMYVSGKMHGLYEEWYQNGNKASEVRYIHGVMDGKYKRWWENGEKVYEMIYKNGKVEEVKVP